MKAKLRLNQLAILNKRLENKQLQKIVGGHRRTGGKYKASVGHF